MNTNKISGTDLYNISSNKENGQPVDANEWNKLSNAVTKSHNIINSLVDDMIDVTITNITAEIDVNPKAIDIESTSSTNITISTSSNSEDINVEVFREGNSERISLGKQQGKLLLYTDLIQPTSYMDITYTGEFDVYGKELLPLSKSIVATSYIYYGHGTTVDNVTYSKSSRLYIGGDTALFNITTASGDFIFFKIPKNIRLSKLELVSQMNTTMEFDKLAVLDEKYDIYRNRYQRGSDQNTYKITLVKNT